MILTIGFVAFATILAVEGSGGRYSRCEPRYIPGGKDHPSHRFCDVNLSEVKHQTWYQDEAVLQVIGGNFRVQLLQNDSVPILLRAERKGIVNVTRGFARISTLEWLSLEDNIIESLESFVFEELPGLVHLNLARNRIRYLDKYCFQGLSKLEVLNLNHNALTDSIGFSVNDDTRPALTELYLQHNQLKRFDMYNERTEILCNSNLKSLYLSNNSIEFIAVSSTFKSLELICISAFIHVEIKHNMRH